MINKIKTMLHEANYSCVISKGDEIRTFNRKGVLDLYLLQQENPDFLKNASVADKITGKAAATIMAYAGISTLYTDIISISALHFLRRRNIEVEFGKIVPFIKNRTGTDWCPLEKVCFDIESVEISYAKISEFIEVAQARQSTIKNAG